MKSPVCLADAHCKSSLDLSCSMVLIEIKGPFKLNELTYAWASKLGNKDSLSNTGSTVHGFGSLYETSVRITKIQIVCYRLEELSTLHHSNFAIMRRQVKELTQRMGCLNELQTGLSGDRYFWIKYGKDVPVGTPPVDRNGACFYWNECSITLQLCSIRGIRGTPSDSHWKQLRQLLSTLVCGPL